MFESVGCHSQISAISAFVNRRSGLLAKPKSNLAVCGVHALPSSSRDVYKRQDLMLANVEALATPEQPNTNDCISDPNYDCEALHPTDPSQDKRGDNARW